MPIVSPIKVLCTVAVAATLALAGCTTVNPYSRQPQTSNAAKGAAIGAAAGGVIGAVSDDDDRGRHALIGAAIGAIAGGGVGYYMDVQEAKLRQRLSGTGVSVSRVGNDIILNMPGNVTFATDSAALRPEFFDVLNSVATVLNEYEKTMIVITGHTDSRGSAAYNMQLSQERAASVGQYLRSQDIKPIRVVTRGAGETRPVATNDTAAGRQQNRRVELRLEPITQSDL